MNKAYTKLIEMINTKVPTANIDDANTVFALMDDNKREGDSRYRATLIVRYPARNTVAIIQASYRDYSNDTDTISGFTLDRYVETMALTFAADKIPLGTTTLSGSY